ncbi:hypothetical protein [Amycolatopsis sp. WQ 127309]|uniref:hypothetical protein n=1 Tax=Amycolatopsis sp. WQ 127309 TaxID=2932773 RepID=UPI001FF1FFEE|nr:hypothetical protein [Amycolatopsis sp. WQ 127309]UOZ06777.1 hypothetical protein MUY22_00340 [Amycolatopsis sp. WQ 127309]
MSRKTAKFVAIGVACLIAGILVVVSAILRSGNLDAADKWASVIEVYLNIAALVVAVVGVFTGLFLGRGRRTASGTRQVITADGGATVDARRAQHVSGAPATDVDQTIAGTARSTVHAADAQIVNDVEDVNGSDA